MIDFINKNLQNPHDYTISLHDALPISRAPQQRDQHAAGHSLRDDARHAARDRKSTRLNSSHRCISYAVFCLKKKKAQFNVGVIFLLGFVSCDYYIYYDMSVVVYIMKMY